MLKRIARYVTEGGPTRRDQILEDVKSYSSYKKVLSMINGILLKGERLIIPASIRKKKIEATTSSTYGNRVKTMENKSNNLLASDQPTNRRNSYDMQHLLTQSEESIM